MVGGEGCACQKPVRHEGQENGHNAKVHIIVAVIVGVIPMVAHAGRLPLYGVIGIFQSQQRVLVAVGKVDPALQEGLCHQLILVSLLRVLSVPQGQLSHGQDAGCDHRQGNQHGAHRSPPAPALHGHRVDRGIGPHRDDKQQYQPAIEHEVAPADYRRRQQQRSRTHQADRIEPPGIGVAAKPIANCFHYPLLLIPAAFCGSASWP